MGSTEHYNNEDEMDTPTIKLSAAASTENREKFTNKRNMTLKNYKYLNYDINILQHKDVPFLIVVDDILLRLLGYKNDKVVCNNISPNNKFRANEIIDGINMEAWLLDEIGLKQLINSTNNPKITAFKNWLKREILHIPIINDEMNDIDDKLRSECQREYTNDNEDDEDILLYNYVYLISINDKISIVSKVENFQNVDMFYRWSNLNSQQFRKLMNFDINILNMIFKSTRDFGNLIKFINAVL